jgi:hypothetical protein
MDLNPFVNANQEWVLRANKRWADAATSIGKGTYEPSHLFRDLLDSVLGDPLQWVNDVSRETATSRILIPAQGLNGPKSSLIPAKNPNQTKITPLARLGGNDQMVVGTHVDLDKPPQTAPGTVQVVLQNLNLAGAVVPPGIYLGFIYEDQLLLAEVVVLR